MHPIQLQAHPLPTLQSPSFGKTATRTPPSWTESPQSEVVHRTETIDKLNKKIANQAKQLAKKLGIEPRQLALLLAVEDLDLLSQIISDQSDFNIMNDAKRITLKHLEKMKTYYQDQYFPSFWSNPIQYFKILAEARKRSNETIKLLKKRQKQEEKITNLDREASDFSSSTKGFLDKLAERKIDHDTLGKIVIREHTKQELAQDLRLLDKKEPLDTAAKRILGGQLFGFYQDYKTEVRSNLQVVKVLEEIKRKTQLTSEQEGKLTQILQLVALNNQDKAVAIDRVNDEAEQVIKNSWQKHKDIERKRQQAVSAIEEDSRILFPSLIIEKARKKGGVIGELITTPPDEVLRHLTWWKERLELFTEIKIDNNNFSENTLNKILKFVRAKFTALPKDIAGKSAEEKIRAITNLAGNIDANIINNSEPAEKIAISDSASFTQKTIWFVTSHLKRLKRKLFSRQSNQLGTSSKANVGIDPTTFGDNLPSKDFNKYLTGKIPLDPGAYHQSITDPQKAKIAGEFQVFGNKLTAASLTDKAKQRLADEFVEEILPKLKDGTCFVKDPNAGFSSANPIDQFEYFDKKLIAEVKRAEREQQSSGPSEANSPETGETNAPGREASVFSKIVDGVKSRIGKIGDASRRAYEARKSDLGAARQNAVNAIKSFRERFRYARQKHPDHQAIFQHIQGNIDHFVKNPPEGIIYKPEKSLEKIATTYNLSPHQQKYYSKLHQKLLAKVTESFDKKYRRNRNWQHFLVRSEKFLRNIGTEIVSPHGKRDASKPRPRTNWRKTQIDNEWDAMKKWFKFRINWRSWKKPKPPEKPA